MRVIGVVLLSIFTGLMASSANAADLLTSLEMLPGIEASETTTDADVEQGLRRFALQIEQPVDHFDESAGTFKQKLVLFHRGYDQPMVLQTSGYAIFSERLSRVARAYGTNQIQVEHRFFEKSTPDPKDWSKLTVRQSAEDFHRIVEAFKSLYPGRWVNTGGSKGGMTSIYHRRFFPNDLDGTLADVAPLSFSTDDDRYVEFVDAVGGEKYSECRASLENLQGALLSRREEILPSIDGEFSLLGGKQTAYEHAVIELPFIFWQYGNPEGQNLGCAGIPEANSDAEALTAFFKGTNDPSSYGDESVLAFQPYYYQAAAELGAPGSKLIHLQEFLTSPYSLDLYLPGGQSIPYTNSTMHDVANWVAHEASGMMFVYGEYDPWTAGAFRDINGDSGSDNHWYQVPGGNHGSNYAQLGDDLNADAVAVLSRWLDKAPVVLDKAAEFEPLLEDIEQMVLRRRRFR